MYTFDIRVRDNEMTVFDVYYTTKLREHRKIGTIYCIKRRGSYDARCMFGKTLIWNLKISDLPVSDLCKEAVRLSLAYDYAECIYEIMKLSE